jgi:hypothetical protein
MALVLPFLFWDLSSSESCFSSSFFSLAEPPAAAAEQLFYKSFLPSHLKCQDSPGVLSHKTFF